MGGLILARAGKVVGGGGGDSVVEKEKVDDQGFRGEVCGRFKLVVPCLNGSKF